MADHNLSARETPTRPSSTAVSVPPPVRESRPPLRGPAMRHQGRVPGAMSNPQLNNNEGMISPMHADPHFAFHLAQQQQLLLGSSARQIHRFPTHDELSSGGGYDDEFTRGARGRGRGRGVGGHRQGPRGNRRFSPGMMPDMSGLSLTDEMSIYARSPHGANLPGQLEARNESMGYFAMPNQLAGSLAAYPPAYWDEDLMHVGPVTGMAGRYPYAPGMPPIPTAGHAAATGGQQSQSFGQHYPQGSGRYPEHRGSSRPHFAPSGYVDMEYGGMVPISPEMAAYMPLGMPPSFFPYGDRRRGARPGYHGPGINHYGMQAGGRGGSYGARGSPRPAVPGGNEQAHKPRSQLLEDFRASTKPGLQLSQLKGHMAEFASDQHGSRFIQRKLEDATEEEKNAVFEELQPVLSDLMMDVFGNHVIQKIIVHGTAAHKDFISDMLRGQVLQLSLQMYGCRTIQKAIESFEGARQQAIVDELEGHVMRCVKDQNGNHVIQRCVEYMAPDTIQFIVDAFKGQVLALAMHPYGCRVIQRTMTHCSEQQAEPIIAELMGVITDLVKDQYGNYCVQHILEHGSQQNKDRIIEQVTGSVLVMSQHKFASNVVEKCLVYGTPLQRQAMLDEVLQEADREVDSLYVMVKDQYANYVVQKMIDISTEPTRQQLLDLLKPYISSLRRYTYGKHIISKVEQQGVHDNMSVSSQDISSSNLETEQQSDDKVSRSSTDVDARLGATSSRQVVESSGDSGHGTL